MQELVLKALERDPSLADAHGTLALGRLHYDWNWTEAEKEFKRSLALNPSDADVHHFYAHYLLAVNRKDDSIAHTKRALEINPFDPMLEACMGWHSMFARQYDDTVEHALKGIKLAPGIMALTWAHMVAGWGYEQKAMFPDAIAHFQAAVKAMDADPMSVASLGHGFAVSGQKKPALEILSKLFERAKKEYISAYDIAIIYAGLGDRDQAFKWLDQASVDRSGYLVHVRWDPRLDYLHSDPRFERLLKRIGLP